MSKPALAASARRIHDLLHPPPPICAVCNSLASWPLHLINNNAYKCSKRSAFASKAPSSATP